MSTGVGVGCVLLTLAIAMPAASGMPELEAPGTGPILLVLVLAEMVPGITPVTALSGWADVLDSTSLTTGNSIVPSTVGLYR